jgi:hypothetical protein
MSASSSSISKGTLKANNENLARQSATGHDGARGESRSDADNEPHAGQFRCLSSTDAIAQRRGNSPSAGLSVDQRACQGTPNRSATHRDVQSTRSPGLVCGHANGESVAGVAAPTGPSGAARTVREVRLSTRVARAASRIARSCRKRVRMRLRAFVRSSSGCRTRVARLIRRIARTHRSYTLNDSTELRPNNQQRLSGRRVRARKPNVRGQSVREAFMT